MLSAFTARPIIEFRQRDKSRIESIVAQGDRVLVGLNSGALRVYRLNELPPADGESNGQHDAKEPSPSNNGDENGSQAPLKPTDLLREVEKFSNRSIDQLAIIKEANIIISLSNYNVHLHDLQTYEHIETLAKSKNASSFAVTSNIVRDSDTDIPEIISRLAVAVKRRLYLWSWQESEVSGDVGEIVLSESIRSVTWASANKLVCGMNGGYVLVDVQTNEIEDIVSPGSVGTTGPGSRFGAVSSAGMGYMGLGGYMPKPLAAKLADGELLLAKDINTLFVDDQGKPLEKRQVPWQSAPDSIGYSYPYIVALQPPSKGSLEVRNPDTLSLIQTISLPGAAQLHFSSPTSSLSHAGKGFHISSDRCVWKMQATDYDSQVKQLVDAGNYDEAISLLNLLEDALLTNKVETMREVKMIKAEMLFKEKKFRQSMDLFNEDDVHAPPERVLKLFPPYISGEFSGWTDEADGDSNSVKSPRKSNGTRPNSRDGSIASSPPTGGFAKLLMGGGHKKSHLSDAGSIRSSNPETEDTAKDGSKKPASKLLDGKDLNEAVLELNSYLAGTRARLQRIIDPVTGKLKPRSDSSATDEDAEEKFLRTSPTEEEKKLEEETRNTFRLVDTTLFRAYMHSRPTLASSLFRIPNFCDPEVVNEKLLENNRYTELIDFFHGKKLHKQALELLRKFGSATKPDPDAPTLHGPDRAIQYLQNLPPSEIDLILEHAGWVLKANPDYAIEIFIGDTENAETLPRDKVVSFLRELDTKLEGRYLEHVVDELDDRTPELQNRLVELYIKNLGEMKKTKEWDDLMERFVTFLRKPGATYSMSRAFSMLPKDDPSFYEAQAIVLSNMGQHKQALEIYVFKMKNYHKAEEYCNQVYRSDNMAATNPIDSIKSSEDDEDATPSIYHTLLSLYLKPAPPNKPSLEPALDLLSKHGSRLPATSTLGLIPDDLPVNSLESYFRGRIRSANSLVNETRIVAGLRKAEGISIAARLHLGEDAPGKQGGRNRHVTITDERHCVVCHKKLGGGAARMGGTVVAVLPDNTAVHYGCLSRATGQKREPARVPSWGRGF